MKSRYQNSAHGWHQYKFRPHGLEIYPSVHFIVHEPNYINEQLDDALIPINKLWKRNKSKDNFDIYGYNSKSGKEDFDESLIYSNAWSNNRGQYYCNIRTASYF